MRKVKVDKRKLIKDPIYGYVEIVDPIILDLLDTAEFQRLRNVLQTSYTSLYPASVHNRFLHSLGVYYLGCIVLDNIKNNSCDEVNAVISSIKGSFVLACFLHDVGHAPFSHSGEDFFLGLLSDNSNPLIYKALDEMVSNKKFSEDFDYINNSNKQNIPSKPHEVMSAIVGIQLVQKKRYEGLSFDKSFFARCITGIRYAETSTENSIKNCLISLLHSSVIDVDKLDYILRDAYMTGFYSTSIDYERLFTGLRLVKDDDISTDQLIQYEIAYHKNALSVIENFIYANDNERKWIQTHPVIQYEMALVKAMIRNVEKYVTPDDDESLFCMEALSQDGKEINSGNVEHPLRCIIRLLSDEDILFLSKNLCSNSITEEFIARDKRRKPLWKSEAEYKAIIEDFSGSEALKQVEAEVKKVEKKLIEDFGFPALNEKILAECERKYEQEMQTPNILDTEKNTLKQGRELILKWLRGMKNVAKKNHIPFDFAIVTANKFTSSFNKEEINAIKIWFPQMNKCRSMKEVQPPLVAQEGRKDMFFIYYNKNSVDSKDRKNIDINKVVKDFRDCLVNK